MINTESSTIEEEVVRNAHGSPIQWVFYRGKNYNSLETASILYDLALGKIGRADFCQLFEIEASETKFLFVLSRVARLHLNFLHYCGLVRLFSSWNQEYRSMYQVARMFKNMILRKAIGENFPIVSAVDFKKKLACFNRLTKLPITTYLDILDVSSQDFICKKISQKQYIQVIYLILKCVSKGFESEVCRRVSDVFYSVGNPEKGHAFFQLIYHKKVRKSVKRF